MTVPELLSENKVPVEMCAITYGTNSITHDNKRPNSATAPRDIVLMGNSGLLYKILLHELARNVHICKES